MTETWNTVNNVDFCRLDGYKCINTIRGLDQRGGGVSILCLNQYRVEKISELCMCNEFIESCVVKISVGSGYFFVVGVYRPPNNNTDHFMSTLETILQSEILRNKDTVLAGDLNINLTDVFSSSVTNFVNYLNSLHFIPLINKPTRFPPNGGTAAPTTLDHIWINKVTPYISGILYYDISDHCPTVAHFSPILPRPSNTKQKIIFRPFSENNLNFLITKIENINWSETFANNDVNISFSKFNEIISRLFCESFPLKTKYVAVKQNSKPWIKNEIKNLIKEKSHYFGLFKRGFISKEVNNSIKNRVNKAVTKAKNSYYLNCFENAKKDMRKSWEIIGELVGCGSKKSKIIDFFENRENEANLRTVEDFNDFFANVGNVLNPDGTVPNLDFDRCLNWNNRNPHSFFLKLVNREEILKIISNLKLVKSHIDSMPVKIFISLRHLLAPPLVELINMSFKSGVYPDDLKIARLVPIYKKKGEISDPSNYRPISCLPYLGKIFEKCLSSRLISFCNKFSLISSSQFGFQSNKSTGDALIHLTEIIYNSLNNKKHNATVLIDLKKAFDSVSHRLLLKKFEFYGVRGLPLNLFRSYLTNRRSYTELGSYRSGECIISSGVPQGSIISPICFLLFINDLPAFSSHFNTTLFADDTTLSISDSNYENMVQLANTELINLTDWIKTNELCMNVDKTEVLLFSNRTIPNVPQSLSIDDISLEYAQSCKFLGVLLDSKLSFRDHINLITSKISKYTGILYRIRDRLPLQARMNFYYAFIYPYLIYNVEVWGSTYQTHLVPLIIQHKRVIRTITNSRSRDHTTPLFCKLNLLKFQDIYKFQICVKMFKLIENGEFQTQQARPTRQNDLLLPEFHRLSLTQHAFSYKGPFTWNTLPITIRNIPKIKIFKKTLKTYLLEQYEIAGE